MGESIRYEIERLKRQIAQLEDNLTHTQNRCTELLEDNRRLRRGIVLPGWHCPSCKAFNGEAKEVLIHCRACGIAKPT